MNKGYIKTKLITLFLIIGFHLGSIASLLALDVNLWNLPRPQGSSVVWDDQRLEINGIQASGTHLRSDLKMDEIIQYYKDVFESRGWQVKEYFKEQNIIVFIKGDSFMYVAGKYNGDYAPSDVYLISSPSDLALCKIIASYMDPEGIEMRGDAEGSDIIGIPRYPQSKRMISIFAPYEGAILLYQATTKPTDVAHFYRRYLEQNGWELLAPFRPELLQAIRIPQLDNISFMLFQKGNETLFINANLLPQGAANKEMTVITVVKNMLEEFSYTER